MDDSKLYDAIVIGGGPAGLTAGMYLARARYRTLVIEKEDFGGQITITAEVVNYPGVPRTNGHALTKAMRQQAQDFGAELTVGDVTGIEEDPDRSGLKIVHTKRGDYRCFAVILAMGAAPRKIGFDGELEYAGRGVAYCATCDGEFFTGKDVIVVGGGFAAAEESVFLTRFARKVMLLVREDDFTCDAMVAQKAKDNPNIEIHYGTELVGVQAGEQGLDRAVWRSVATGTQTVWQPDDGGTFGVFVFAGYVPQTAVVKGVVDLDPQGYVIADEHMQTSRPGIFAAGDLRVKDLRQVVTATADGAIAAVNAERYAAAKSLETGIVPKRVDHSVYEQEEQQAARNKPAGTTPAPAPDRSQSEDPQNTVSAVFNDDVIKQLNVVFSRMARPLTLQLQLDETKTSSDLKAFITELVRLSDGKLDMIEDKVGKIAPNGRGEFDVNDSLPFAAPLVSIMVRDDAGMLVPTGLTFHGVPTGHEFHSFVLGLYNAAGPGQPLIGDEAERIDAIHDPTEIMILVSLTCTMCPETVRASQRIAAANPNVRAEAYDVAHFPELKEKYDVMSVPCIVLNRGGRQTVEFGKKNVSQMLDLIDAL